MIPEKLRIKGFYSYQSEQVIDFQKLLQDGIFGIFGNVGSGKSSILEAMTLALYNRIERISSNENRNYNLMNLKSDKIEIDFEFRISDEKYRIEVRGKRNTKRFSEVPPYNKTTFIWKNEKWEVTKDKTEDILGLSYENFKRTIIIPQGKFLEFLQLTPTDRTEMLQELFSLDKYDLIDKVNIQKDRISENLNQVRGQLQEIGDIKEEDFTNTVLELNQVEEKANIKQNEIINYENKKKEIEAIELSIYKIQNWEKELVKLEIQKPEIEKIEKSWKEYKACRERFGEKIRDLDKLRQEILQLQHEIEQTKSDRENWIIREKDILMNYQKAKEDYQKKEEFIKKSEGWKKAKDYFLEKEIFSNSQKRLNNLNSEWENLHKQIQISQDKKKEWDKLIEEKQKYLEELEKYLEEINSLTEKMNWQREWEDITKQNEKLIKEKEKQETQFLNKLQNSYNQSFTIKEVNLFFIEKENEIQTKKQNLKKEELQNQLKILSENLKVGENCPLCGEVIQSLDHIKTYKMENSNSLLLIEKETECLKEIKSDYQAICKYLEKINEEQNEIQKNLKDYTVRLPKEEEKEKYSKRNDYMNIYKKIKDEKKQIEKELKTFQENFELKQKELNNKEQERTHISLSLSAISARLEVINADIPSEILSKAKDLTLEAMEEKLRIQKDFLLNIERNFEEKSKEYQESEQFKHQLQARYEEKTKRQEELKKKEINLQMEINLELKREPNYTIENVKNVLSQSINEVNTIEKINQYYKEIDQTRRLIQNEKESIGNKPIPTESKERIQEKLKELNLEFQILKENAGSLKSKKNNLEQGLKRKIELEIQKEILENKKERVETLKKLFDKKGFVNFVSTLFLEDLCESANERFYTFTSNRLRLELNEKNEIQVRDLYHDGNYRHIKTLSGGQLFQASLAMALALSDRIQTTSGIGERFFFLDEGFGSLDKDSLAIVFETLKSLRKENRIVGLISHVEEMKSEIRTYLLIKNNQGQGTIVKGNWEKEI